MCVVISADDESGVSGDVSVCDVTAAGSVCGMGGVAALVSNSPMLGPE